MIVYYSINLNIILWLSNSEIPVNNSTFIISTYDSNIYLNHYKVSMVYDT